MSMSASEVQILLAEDDDIDAAMIIRGLGKAGIANPVVRAHDGVEALDIMLGINGHRRLVPPYLLLADIRMPRMDGLALIGEVRNNRQLQRTVIFVLTTSDNERDRIAAYDAHIAGYIIKSDMPDQYARLAGMLEYYFMIVSPPPTGEFRQIGGSC